jgi:ferric-dicitrate binding protein FerR (iron transport regulator)
MTDRSTKNAALTDGEVRQVFRALSDEHLQERRRDDREAAWRIIEGRLESNRLRMVPPAASRWSWQTLLGHWGPGRALAVAAAAAITIGVAGVWSYQSGVFSGNDLTFVVEGISTDAQSVSVGQAAPDHLGGQLIATEDRPAALAFSDESRIELRPYTTLRVHVEEGSRVVTRLAQGELLVHVEHHAETDYRFRAGTYEVRVVGTAFSLGYQPESQQLDVSMSEGRVTIVDAGGRERFLSAGESLHLPERRVGEASSPSGSMQPSALETTTPSPAKAGSAGVGPAAGGQAGPTVPGEVKSASESYRTLAAAGRFQQIVTSAKATGLENVFQSKPASELQELAQAARYTGELGLAERTWKELQTRYRSQEAGQNASFFLGRLAEQRGRQSEALRQYDVYLASAPRGVFAAEALGRKMLIVQSTQGSAAAKPVAAEYLKRFRSGAYSGAARELVND